MIPAEFQTAVKSKNLLRTRIMLKDAMLFDLTMENFRERYKYAKSHLPNLMVKHDGEKLDSNRDNWTKELLGIELVRLINNFSQERLDYVEQMLQVVYATDIKIIEEKRKQVSNIQRPSRQSTKKLRIANYNPETHKKFIYQYGKEIGEMMQRIDSPDRMYLSDIIKLEEKVNALRAHILTYKKNKGMR